MSPTETENTEIAVFQAFQQAIGKVFHVPELRREELPVRRMIDEAVRLVSESPIGFRDKRLLAAARSLGKQAAYWKTASSHGDFRWSKQSRQRAAELE
ncbi:MAG: hypothetical protein WAU32_07940, partial [Thermoanaerobaculia bacterium]